MKACGSKSRLSAILRSWNQLHYSRMQPHSRRKLRLGTSVLITVIRNPVQLAKSLASLDQLSHGRLIVGVGVGGPHVPEAVFGVSSEHRGRRFVEGLQVMKALWTQSRATMSGEFWRFENVADGAEADAEASSAAVVWRS